MTSENSVSECSLIAILRGVLPERVVEVGEAINEAGISIIEVPLNSPDAFSSITKLAARGRPDWMIGAGTVLNVEDVRRTHEAGGRLVVAPNCKAIPRDYLWTPSSTSAPCCLAERC